MNAVEQLCPNCGLCCDSTLFSDVELQAGDDAARLREHGLIITKKGKNKIAFAQSCACFDGKLCKIYADRPKRCGLFECGLLKKVQARELTADAALKKIFDTKKRAENVRGMLRESGQHDESMALTHRYAEVMRAPIDFSDDANAERRGELMLTVGDLMQRVERDFLH